MNEQERRMKLLIVDDDEKFLKTIAERLGLKHFDVVTSAEGTQAIKAAKKGTIIHFYTFGREEEFKEIRKNIKEECKKHKKKCRILRTVKAGHYAPGVYRVCVDFKLQ